MDGFMILVSRDAGPAGPADTTSHMSLTEEAGEIAAAMAVLARAWFEFVVPVADSPLLSHEDFRRLRIEALTWARETLALLTDEP